MTKFHFLLILTCMICMFYTSCEKSQIADGLLSNTEIQQREIDDCSECPISYCCCTIELQDGSPDAMLAFCGVYTNETVTTPCGTFNPPSPCPSVSGTLSPITLILISDPRKHFCLPLNGAFRIFNNSGSTVRLKMTCRASDTNPVYQYFTLEDTTEIYFDGNGDCELSEC